MSADKRIRPAGSETDSEVLADSPQATASAEHSPETVHGGARSPNARRQPMALDSGTSSDAAAAASAATLGLVRQGILELLREHPGTDPELSVRWNARTGHPAWPKVTDQRLRTARKSLERDGLVRDSGAIAFTPLGNRCVLWEAIS